MLHMVYATLKVYRLPSEQRGINDSSLDEHEMSYCL